MPIFRKLLSALGAVVLGVSSLSAQYNRMGYPSAVSATGLEGAWSIRSPQRYLVGSIPMGAVGGELPVALGMRLDAQYHQLTGSATTGNPRNPASFNITTWMNQYPMAGSFHFGYIANGSTANGAPGPAYCVLEDGTVLAVGSALPGGVLPGGDCPAAPLGLQGDFGFNPTASSQAAVSVDQSVGLYAASVSDLKGSVDWTAKVQGLVPQGFAIPAPSAWILVFTKDKARVMVYLPEFNNWVPILWVDKFQHWVSFQWTKKTASLPANVNAMYAVKVLNRFGKGALVQWAAYNSTVWGSDCDLLRADFIGMDAPSMLIHGYPGFTTQAPSSARIGVVDSVGTVAPLVGGAIFRPTLVTIGPLDQVRAPSWLPFGTALPPKTPSSSGPVSNLLWTYGYDANLAAVTSIQEPTGLITRFTYDSVASFAFPFAQKTGIGTAIQNLLPNAVQGAQSTAANAPTRTQKWLWDTSVGGETAIVYGDTFDPNAAYLRDVRTVFPTSSYAASNGAKTYSTLRDGATGTVYQRTDWTYSASGTDSSLTFIQTATTSYPNAQAPSTPTPTQVMTNGYSNSGLSLQWTTVAAAPAGSGVGTSAAMLQRTAHTYDNLPTRLEPSRLRTTTVTNYYSDGVTALMPAPPVQRLDYDGGTPTGPVPAGPGLVTKMYSDAGSLGQIGQNITWETPNGRPSVVAVFNSSFSAGVINQQTYGWDAATAHLSTLTTTYATALGKAATSAMVKSYDLGSYDSMDRPLKVTDERSVVTNATYDTYGRVATKSSLAQPGVTYSYSADLLTVTTTQGARTTTVSRDPYGRTLSTLNPDGTKVVSTYDALGRLQSTRTVSNRGTAQVPASYSYDLLNRITQTVNPGGKGVVVSSSYGATSTLLTRTTQTVDPSGINASSTVDRNGLGQVVASADPKGTTTATTYNGLGQAIQVTIHDAVNNLTQTRSFTFDGWGRLGTRTEPETGTTTFSAPDALNNLTSITENGARTRTLSFDGLGRLLTQVGGSDSLSYSYSQANLMSATSVSNGLTISQGFTYTGPGKQMDSETTVIGSSSFPINYSYDPSLGHLNSIKYPSGCVVGYTYDSLERVQGVTYNGTAVLSMGALPTYNEWGQRQRITYASSAYDDWSTKDGGTHLDTWTIGYVTGGLVDNGNPRTFNYDSGERLSQAGEWSPLVHDSLDRLTSASAPALGLSSGFGYDGYSNNTTHTSTGVSSVFVNTFSLGPQVGNQIPPATLAGQPTGWTYSGAGKEATSFGVVAGSSTSVGLAWDGLGRLRMASLPGISVLTNAYAPSGLRVLATDSANAANSRYYAYTSGGLLLGEYTVAGGAPVWKRDVIYLGGRALAEVDGAGVHVLHKDHLGTPRVITSGSTGTIQGRQAYASYGEKILADTYIPVTGYTGHLQTDPTGLIYMRGRFYSPAWHTFVNSDQGVDPNSWNQRNYVGGSPFMGMDPTGRMAESFCYKGNEYVCDDDGFCMATGKGCATVEVTDDRPTPVDPSPVDSPTFDPSPMWPQAPKPKKDCVTRQQILDAAAKWAGTPYGHGQQVQGVCGDCSGTVQAIYGYVGIQIQLGAMLSGSSAQGIFNSPSLSVTTNPQPGDIAYWSKPYNHTMIFSGNDKAWGSRKPGQVFGNWPLSWFGNGASPTYLTSPKICDE